MRLERGPVTITRKSDHRCVTVGGWWAVEGGRGKRGLMLYDHQSLTHL